MAISERTRKLLWGRSGSRCAMCRKVLLVNATQTDDPSVVGDECHINSRQIRGPRYDPTLATDKLDEYANLILLCRVDHKTVDDQPNQYTADALRAHKERHEKWVQSALNGNDEPKPVWIRRIKENVPTYLVRLTSGREVMTILENAHAFAFDHDEPRSKAEMEMIRSFLQEAQDWGDVGLDQEAGDRVSAAFRFSELLTELDQAGLWVFGGREVRRLEGGCAGPSAFPVAILSVKRASRLQGA